MSRNNFIEIHVTPKEDDGYCGGEGGDFGCWSETSESAKNPDTIIVSNTPGDCVRFFRRKCQHISNCRQLARDEHKSKYLKA